MKSPVLLDLGFRVFFLLAGIYAVIIVGLWTGVYFGHLQLDLGGLTPFQWHAHEMVFGYAVAVIAGFLLTATANWTGLRTLNGWPLGGLAATWLTARVLFLGGELLASGIVDFLFLGLLFIAVATPVLRVRQGRQAGILGKLVLLPPAVLASSLGALGMLQQGVQLGNFAGLYIIIGLILMMGRRVVPLFIASGVPETVDPGNPRWLDIASLVLYLLFFVAVLVPGQGTLAAATAAALFLVNAWRLLAWHTPGIWRRPLVWVLYLGMWFVTAGFALHLLGWAGKISHLIAVHAFAYGGIGLMTLGMMSRVSLGHTGRSIHDPPLAIQVAFGILLGGALVRVFLPLGLPASMYMHCIGASQLLWMLAFAIFVAVYTPMLLAPRVDEPSLGASSPQSA